MPQRIPRVRASLRWLAVAASIVLGTLVAKPLAQSPPPLTNADVIKMVAAQLGDPVIGRRDRECAGAQLRFERGWQAVREQGDVRSTSRSTANRSTAFRAARARTICPPTHIS